jgi:hypothetical protein
MEELVVSGGRSRSIMNLNLYAKKLFQDRLAQYNKEEVQLYTDYRRPFVCDSV